MVVRCGHLFFKKFKCVPFSFTSELGGLMPGKVRGLALKVSNQGGPAQLENVAGFGAAAWVLNCRGPQTF